MVFACVVGFAGGCTHSPVLDAWAAQHGGIIGDEMYARAEIALSRLTGGAAPGLCVQVLKSDRAGAYAWHDGTLFVTRRLLALLDDDELAAVLAHEIGHLEAADQPPRALEGDIHADGPAINAEVRADEAACGLLQKRGIPKRSLASALVKVGCEPEMSPQCRSALLDRIRRLGN
jgi:Zn-dependent protease with chaperone function